MRHAYDLNREEWTSWTTEQGLPSYGGEQIYHWIYQKRNLDTASYSNLSPKIRQKLSEEFTWETPSVASIMESKDGSKKLLLKLKDSVAIETVIMPGDKRNTLCVSSQSGCGMACAFCQTGKMGFVRNLTCGEIIAQVAVAEDIISPYRISRLVFMGMGEPLNNFNGVMKACSIFTDLRGLGFAPSRITISTAGIADKIRKMGTLLPLRLAVSLHAADNCKRSKIMPINRKVPLEALKEALMEYPNRHKITIEYIMIDNFNDSVSDAKKLVKFLHGLKAKVNLIPVNPIPGSPFLPSTESRLLSFQRYLASRSIPAPIRRSKGQDIMAACGQLAAAG